MSAQPARPFTASSTRVLVVDDDPAIRRVLSRTLAGAGFQVSTASDGAPALRLAEVSPPDLVLIDVNMPTSGLEIVRRLRKKYGATIYVAMLTGDDSPETRNWCRAAGADDVMIKPISPRDLCRKLTAAAIVLKALPAVP